MPIRAVFLDLDDTLCDTIGCRPQRMRAALSHVCAVTDRSDLDELVARALEPIHGPVSARGLATVLDEIGVRDAALVADAERIFFTDYSALRFFPEVPETVARLSRQYVLGIISNAEAAQEGKVRHLGLDRLIRHVTLSGVVGFEKPDPRIFAAALDAAGIAASAAVFVGDRLDTDIAGAKAAGMRAVHSNHRGDPRRDDLPAPDATITRFAELPAVLERLRAAEL